MLITKLQQRLHQLEDEREGFQIQIQKSQQQIQIRDQALMKAFQESSEATQDVRTRNSPHPTLTRNSPHPNPKTQHHLDYLLTQVSQYESELRESKERIRQYEHQRMTMREMQTQIVPELEKRNAQLEAEIRGLSSKVLNLQQEEEDTRNQSNSEEALLLLEVGSSCCLSESFEYL